MFYYASLVLFIQVNLKAVLSLILPPWGEWSFWDLLSFKFRLYVAASKQSRDNLSPMSPVITSRALRKNPLQIWFVFCLYGV